MIQKVSTGQEFESLVSLKELKGISHLSILIFVSLDHICIRKGRKLNIKKCSTLCVEISSQPLHNFLYGDAPANDGKSYPEIGLWNKEHHGEFDDALDAYLPLDKNDRKTFKNMLTTVKITSLDDLKRQIGKIANSSIALANRCYSEKRIISKDEALRQVAMSVYLLKAIVESTKKQN